MACCCFSARTFTSLKTFRIFRMSFLTGNQAPEILKPGDNPFHLPQAAVPSGLPAIPGCSASYRCAVIFCFVGRSAPGFNNLKLPLPRSQVGSDNNRFSLMPLGRNLEQKLRPFFGKTYVTWLINNTQRKKRLIACPSAFSSPASISSLARLPEACTGTLVAATVSSP